jgi:hypothetical protein
MAEITITTQDDLPGPDGDEPYALHAANQAKCIISFHP